MLEAGRSDDCGASEGKVSDCYENQSDEDRDESDVQKSSGLQLRVCCAKSDGVRR